MIFLKLITPQVEVNEEIVWLEAETSSGTFVIRNNHTSMIISLKDGNTLSYCLLSGKNKSVSIKEGVLNFHNNKTVVIARSLKQ